MPQIEVTFDIDANGILHVSAKDLGTGKEQKITITASSGLSKEEVEKMRKDAEAHAEEDKAKREEIEARNETDSVVYRSERLLKDNADKLDAAAKSKIEDAVKAAREALAGTDADKIRASRDKLNEAWQAASEQLYKAAAEKAQTTKTASSGPAPGGEAKAEKDQGPIIDAEVVDEKKK
jgi:molecular chaperone DnaK